MIQLSIQFILRIPNGKHIYMDMVRNDGGDTQLSESASNLKNSAYSHASLPIIHIDLTDLIFISQLVFKFCKFKTKSCYRSTGRTDVWNDLKFKFKSQNCKWWSETDTGHMTPNIEICTYCIWCYVRALIVSRIHDFTYF